MEAWVPTLLAVAAVSLVSLVGAAALSLRALRSHRVLLAFVALAAGTLLGDSFLHLLPEASHAWEDQGTSRMGLVVLAGFLVFFLLEVVLRARHSHLELTDGDAHAHPPHGTQGHGSPHHHAHAHDDGPHGVHTHDEHAPVAPFAWANLLGDALHNLLDGAVIAAAFLVDTGLGIATTIAVLLHEVPQELGDFAVLLRAGLKPRKALLFNFASALLSVVGALVVLALPVSIEALELYGLPFIAGAFVYIAAADLIPELHHHGKGRDAALITAMLLVGLVAMALLLQLEGLTDAGAEH